MLDRAFAFDATFDALVRRRTAIDLDGIRSGLFSLQIVGKSARG